VIKDQSVEQAIDEVAKRPCIDHGHADNEAFGIVLLYNLAKVPATKDHGRQARERQQHLASITTQFPSPGHAFIFDEIYPEPRKTKHIGYRTQMVMSLDKHLQALVRNQNEYDQ